MSLTSTWVFLKQHSGYLWPTVAVLLAFGAGWQVGKVTSPYYAAHPIVFEESCEADCASPGRENGSPEALNSLLEESRALQAEVKESATPEPSVAAAVATSGKQFVGSVNSDLYHDPSCPAAGRIKDANQVWFASREEAEAAGYSPSQCTKEKLGLP
ncbi:MAG: hypothetical protein AAB538_00150 [Patescibacteria group bacterium]